MEELLKRIGSGLVYIGILLGSIYLGRWYFTAVVFALGLIALIEFQRILRFTGYPALLLYVATMTAFLLAPNPDWLIFVFLCFTLAVGGVLIFYLNNPPTLPFTPLQKLFLSVFYLTGGIVFLAKLPGNFNRELIIGVLCIVWVNDSLSYVVGKLFGRKRSFLVISPKKTLEGYFGGLLFSALTVLLLSRGFTSLSLTAWAGLACVIVVTATLGDLVESMFKRMAGVKDSGAVLPGHGGVLDRMDSLILAAPFTYFVVKFLMNVP